MNRQDIEKLLGGYATGTLTPEEEQALFAAALEDQRLFDALAREQPMRDLLGDPAARAALLASLDERPAPWYRRFALPLAVAAAILLIAVPVVLRRAPRPAQPALVAEVKPPAPPAPVLDSAPPAPAPKAAPSRAVTRRAAPRQEPARLDAPIDAAPPAVVEPAAKSAQPPQGDLKPGSTAETVQVTAQATTVVPAAPAPAPAPAARQFSAASGFLPAQGAAASAKAGMVRALAGQLSRLKYTVLSRQPGGEFTVANPAELRAGDTVELRLETQDTGYAYVAEGEALLASSPIEAGKPFEAVIEPRGAGQRQIECWFSPRRIVWPAAAGNAGGGGGSNSPAALQQHPPSIHITLNYK